ncbi:MAG: hypothetical protein ACK4ZJ_04320 [Allorhizobium sp.]
MLKLLRRRRLTRATVDANFVPWLWADVNMAGERQLFPFGSAKPEVRGAFSRQFGRTRRHPRTDKRTSRSTGHGPPFALSSSGHRSTVSPADASLFFLYARHAASQSKPYPPGRKSSSVSTGDPDVSDLIFIALTSGTLLVLAFYARALDRL